MTETSLYSAELEFEGANASLESIFSELRRRENYDVARIGDDHLRARTHGIEMDLYEDRFEAQVAPYAREDEEAEKLAMLLSAHYQVDTTSLLETGFSSGG